MGYTLFLPWMLQISVDKCPNMVTERHPGISLPAPATRRPSPGSQEAGYSMPPAAGRSREAQSLFRATVIKPLRAPRSQTDSVPFFP